MDLPEVRQCQDEESPSFGSVAVKSAVPFGTWLVANPGVVSINSAGGYWEADDDVVAEWTVLTATSSKQPKKTSKTPE